MLPLVKFKSLANSSAIDKSGPDYINNKRILLANFPVFIVKVESRGEERIEDHLQLGENQPPQCEFQVE